MDKTPSFGGHFVMQQNGLASCRKWKNKYNLEVNSKLKIIHQMVKGSCYLASQDRVSHRRPSLWKIQTAPLVRQNGTAGSFSSSWTTCQPLTLFASLNTKWQTVHKDTQKDTNFIKRDSPSAMIPSLPSGCCATPRGILAGLSIIAYDTSLSDWMTYRHDGKSTMVSHVKLRFGLIHGLITEWRVYYVILSSTCTQL